MRELGAGVQLVQGVVEHGASVPWPRGVSCLDISMSVSVYIYTKQ